MSRAVMQQALEALEKGVCVDPEESHRAIYALRQALAEPEQEPVAWYDPEVMNEDRGISWTPGQFHTAPLYTTPPQPEQNEFNPDWDAMAVMVEEQQRMAKRIAELEAQRKPLTDEEIWNLAANCLDSVAGRLQFARAIERAHGIGEQHE